MASLKDRLREILIHNKLITQEQLTEALEMQKQKGGRLSEIIVGLKFIGEQQLISTLSEGLGMPLIDLKRFKIDPEIAKIIPADIARHYQIIPVSKIGDTVTLAMADPLNIFAIDHVQSLTGYKINPIISSSTDIQQALEATYPDATTGIIDDLMKEMQVSSSIEVVKDESEASTEEPDLDIISQAAPVVQVTNMVLEDAVRQKASDILIEPFDRKLRIRYRVDGVLHEQKAPPASLHASIVSRIKVISDLNIAEHRLPQDGRFKIKMGAREIDYRVSILPSSFGEKVAIRILDKSQATLDIERLGFSEDTVSNIKKTAKLPHGMMLVCGPTGSGKTTTLYSILKFTDSPEKNIVTVEDPVEYQLEGINQVTVHPDIGLTFASALRSILRQDPNIIMIGEIRDYDTVDIAIKSALTGHLVLSTLHTTTAPGAVVRLVNMGVEPFMINASIVCVMSQRLIRKVCTHCREKYELKPDILEQLRIRLDKGTKPLFYRGRGCNACFRTGYAGRSGIAEVLVLGTQIRDAVLRREQEHIVKKIARREGMITLREDGIKSALQGVTSIEEVVRLTAPDD